MFFRNCETPSCPNQVELTFDPNVQPKLYCNNCVYQNYVKYNRSLITFYQYIPNKPAYEPRVDLHIYKITRKDYVSDEQFNCLHVLTGEFDLFGDSPSEKITLKSLDTFFDGLNKYIPVPIIKDKLNFIDLTFKSGCAVFVGNSSTLCFTNLQDDTYLINIQVIR
jgi:hypothetical protein